MAISTESTKVSLHDRGEKFGKPRVNRDGYLVAMAKVARTGIQEYRGYELGLDNDEVVRVYRPEDEIFSPSSMSTYANRPLTVDHPPESVKSDNWRKYAVGYTGEDIMRDGNFIRVPLILTDAAAIEQYKRGKKELSMGYECFIDWVKGVTEDGEEYDAIQRSVSSNHVALVDVARAGREARIGDKSNIQKTLKDERSMKTILIDGISVEFSDQGAQAIEKLQGQLAMKDEASEEALAAAQAEIESLKEEVATLNAELAKRDAEIEELKSKQVGDAEISELVKARATLIAQAAKVADMDYTGMSEREIKIAAVKAHIGDAIKDKVDAYIDARFDILLEDKKSKVVADNKPVATIDNDDGQAAYEASLTTRYLGVK